MAAVRWFRVPIWVGAWQQDVYLYRTLTNEFDFQYHWMYTGRPAGGLPEALRAFREGFTRHHRLDSRGLLVKAGTPVEVGWPEVQAARPAVEAGAYLSPP
jgi:hypothetical protein